MSDLAEFDRLAPVIARALPYTGHAYTVDDVRDLVRTGRAFLWPGVRSAVVTQVVEYPRVKELYFFLAAGDLGEVERLYQIILAWGRAQGCTRAAFVGRAGWQRTFLTKKEGWSPQAVVYVKELSSHG